MVFVVVIIGAVLYCLAPVWLQFLISIINTVVPDPVPGIDEVMMWAVVVGRLIKRPPKVRLGAKGWMRALSRMR